MIDGHGGGTFSLDGHEGKAFHPRPRVLSPEELLALAPPAPPLGAGTHFAGSLKVTSDQPDAFSRSDVDRLEILTESLGTTVQLRHVASQLEASARQYRLMFNEHPHPMWVNESASLRLLAVNRAMLLQ